MTIESINPVTGERIETYDEMTPEEVSGSSRRATGPSSTGAGRASTSAPSG